VILPIRVYGRPAPQGSKEQGGAGQLLESSIYLPAWRQAVKIAAFEAYRDYSIPPAALPLIPRGRQVVIERLWFFVQPDQCRAEGTDEPLGAPDVDKLLRATLDPLGGGRRNTARLYADDSQVQGIRDLWKYRASADSPPGAVILIETGE
jgi:crossover junction endodeoxyribonuclease RusA